MISQADVKIILSAQDQASAAMQQFGRNAEHAMKQAETATDKLNGMMATLKKNWLGITAAVAGASLALNRAWNLAELASKYEQSRQAFHSMVSAMGKDAETEFGKIKKMAAGLIDDKTLVEASNRAMSLGIPLEKIGDLMLIARAKARDMGITTTQAFNDIVTGIGRASPMILDNLGLTLKIGSANEAMAASLGKSVEQLTDADKKFAVLNATIDAGAEALDRHNLSSKTTAERMESMVVTMRQVQLISGQALLRGISVLTGAWYGLGSASLFVSSALWKIHAAYESLKATFTFGSWKKFHEAVAEGAASNAVLDAAAAKEYFGKSKDAFALAFSSQSDFGAAQALAKPPAPGITSPGSTAGKPVKTKSDILTEMEQLDVLARDNEKRFQQVWEENEEWMKTHYFDPVTGMYIDMSEKQVASTESATDRIKDQFADLKLAIEGWGKASADAIIEFAMTGKMSFSGMIDSMIKDLMRMIVYQNITAPLFNAIGLGFDKMINPNSYTVTGTGYDANVAANFTGGGLGFHSGGLATEPSFYRIGVNPRVFDTAPRYHSGIGPGEVAAVLRRDEGVFTPGQMRALGLMANRGNNVTVNVINNTESKITTQENQTADGLQLDVLIDQAVAQKLGQAGSRSNQMLKQNFSVRESMVQR